MYLPGVEVSIKPCYVQLEQHCPLGVRTATIAHHSKPIAQKRVYVGPVLPQPKITTGAISKHADLCVTPIRFLDPVTCHYFDAMGLNLEDQRVGSASIIQISPHKKSVTAVETARLDGIFRAQRESHVAITINYMNQ